MMRSRSLFAAAMLSALVMPNTAQNQFVVRKREDVPEPVLDGSLTDADIEALKKADEKRARKAAKRTKERA